MEGTPLSTTSDPESSFDTKSPDKLDNLEPVLENNEVSLRHSRHIAREALLHQEQEDKNTEKPTDYETFEHRHPGPEAKQLHGGTESPEHIGHVLIRAEADKRRPDTLPSAHHDKAETQLESNKRVESLPRSELLALSEKIVVEGASLRHVYENHLIGEQALRRLISEYLQGENIQQSLQREIVEHEIDFERDPALRDLALPADDSNDTKHINVPGKDALNQLLQHAEAGMANLDDQISYDEQTSNTKKGIDRTTQHYQQLLRPIDIIMGVTIVMLLVLVIVLYFWHH